jgi:hypothetical protein
MPQQANLNAQLQTPTNLQMMSGILGQLFSSGALLTGGKGPVK